MENNFNESMNLGNMVSSGYTNINSEFNTKENNTVVMGSNTPQPPVFNQSTVQPPVFSESVILAGEPQTYTLSGLTLSNAQNIHIDIMDNKSEAVVDTAPPVPPTPPANEIKKEPEPIVYDEIIVPVTLLKSLVTSAKKVATYDAVRCKSQVIGLEFGKNGIKVNASNGKVDYECIDTNIRYNTEMKIFVDIKLLADYLNGCGDVDSIKFAFNENNILTATLPNGSVGPFPEKIDGATNQPVDLNLVFPIKYEDLIKIDYEKFIGSISQSKPIRDLPLADSSYNGTYFSNLVMSSDSHIIYIQENQDTLKLQKFFVGAELCKLLMELNFNSDKFRIGFTTDTNNDVRAITLSDERLTICGNVEPTAPIDENTCTKFWNAQFEHSFTVNTKKLSNAIQRLKLFNANSKDNDYVDISVNGANMQITMVAPVAKENLVVEGNVTGYVGNKRLPMTKLDIILKSIKSEKVTISVDKMYEICVGIKADDYKWIVALYNG